MKIYTAKQIRKSWFEYYGEDISENVKWFISQFADGSTIEELEGHWFGIFGEEMSTDCRYFLEMLKR